MRYSNPDYRTLTSEHPADHWTQRALNEQTDRRHDNQTANDEHGEADVA